jgi:hypothetical protein
MSLPKTYGYKASWRDRAVGVTVNWIINTFATRAYRAFIYMCVEHGREGLHDLITKEDRDD